MYLPLIDLLRFISSLGVMLFHYFSSNIDPETVNPILYYIKHGHLGVQLFFIISGLVIHFSLNSDIKKFISGRFSRIYPLFFIACTFTYLLTLIAPNTSHLTFFQYLKNLPLVLITNTSDLVDGAYWSLTIELIFYGIIGSFVYLFGKKRIGVFYTAWLLISILLFSLKLEGNIISKLILIRYSPYFIFGGVTGLLLTNWSIFSKNLKLYWIVFLALTMLSTIYISNMLSLSSTIATNRFALYDSKSFIFIFLSFFAVILACIYSKRISNPKLINTFKILGAITYPLYLLHQRIGQIVISQFSEYGKVTAISIAVAVLMIFVSYLISKKEIIFRKNINNIMYIFLTKVENKFIFLRSKYFKNTP